MAALTTADLFPKDRLDLPPLRQGETLYSWCAHYHVLSSNPTAHQTSIQLFDHHRAGLKHDFPVGIDRLVFKTQGWLGSREEIMFGLTPLGAFARFLPQSCTQSICDLMGGGSSHRVARMLGLLAMRHGTPAPLKACPLCMHESMTESVSSWWKNDHQHPGTYLCHQHGCQLLVANAEGHRRARHDYLLPHMLSPADWHIPRALSNEAFGRLSQLASWSRALTAKAEMPCVPFDRGTLRDTCHLQAKQMGLVSIDGSLNFKKIRGELHGNYAEIAALPGLEFLDNAKRDAGGFVGFILHQKEGTHHPLMHISLLIFLFESPARFFEMYQRTSQIDPALRLKSLTAERTALRQKLGDLVGKQGVSVNQAAQAEGVTVFFALALLKELGVEYKKRSRIVGTSIESKLVELLKRGESRSIISGSLKIRRNFIKDYLAAHPTLRQEYETELFRRRREEYRARFLQTLEANPSLPIKRIRRETNSGFEWLYRNDREWFLGVLPGIWHR